MTCNCEIAVASLYIKILRGILLKVGKGGGTVEQHLSFFCKTGAVTLIQGTRSLWTSTQLEWTLHHVPVYDFCDKYGVSVRFVSTKFELKEWEGEKNINFLLVTLQRHPKPWTQQEKGIATNFQCSRGKKTTEIGFWNLWWPRSCLFQTGWQLMKKVNYQNSMRIIISPSTSVFIFIIVVPCFSFLLQFVTLPFLFGLFRTVVLLFVLFRAAIKENAESP